MSMPPGAAAGASLDKFFEDVESIKDDLRDLERIQRLVHDANEGGKSLHDAVVVRVLHARMEADAAAAIKKAKSMFFIVVAIARIKPEPGSIRLKEDIHNAHGYQFLVQFALTLCSLHKNQALQSSSKLVAEEDGLNPSRGLEQDTFPCDLSPQLSRLLDVLVKLSQTGPFENCVGKSMISSHGKGMGHNRSWTPSADKFADEVLEISSPKVKDLEAIQMLQDIFLKADNLEVQAEVLNRMFKIFSSHLENYKPS